MNFLCDRIFAIFFRYKVVILFFVFHFTENQIIYDEKKTRKTTATTGINTANTTADDHDEWNLVSLVLPIIIFFLVRVYENLCFSFFYFICLFSSSLLFIKWITDPFISDYHHHHRRCRCRQVKDMTIDDSNEKFSKKNVHAFHPHTHTHNSNHLNNFENWIRIKFSPWKKNI